MSTLRVVNLQNPSSGIINGTLNADGTTTFGGPVVFSASQTFPATSSTLPPSSPTQGATWYDTGVTPAVLKVWNGTAWVPVGGTSSTSAPTLPTVGQQWTDTSQNPPVLKLWNGSAWIPATVALGSTAPTGSLTTGQLWSDTSTTPATLKAWNGTSWVAVQASGGTPGFGLAIDGTSTKVSITTQTGVPTVGTAANQAMTGSLYWDDTLGQLFIRYANSGNPVWVPAAPAGGGGSSGVTSVSGTAPIVVTGTTTPAISISAATATAPGSIEIATLAEAATGTDATRALTPESGVPKTASGMAGAAILPSGTAATAPAGAAGYTRIATDLGQLTFFANGQYFPVGFGAGGSTTNTAAGLAALDSNSTGTNNTAFGQNALTANTTGTDNTATGVDALAANQIGRFNTAIGASALSANTIGTSNTAVGQAALFLNTGDSNTAVGRSAMQFNTSGCCNSAFGFQSLASNTTGSFNTAIGRASLFFNQTGSYNTATGASALQANTTGINNTATGALALAANQIGINNVAVGRNALTNANADSNTAVGQAALATTTSGCANTALGSGALANNTSGCCNVAIGVVAGVNLTTGSGNTIIGAGITGSAGDANTLRIGAGGQIYISGGAGGGLSLFTSGVSRIAMQNAGNTYVENMPTFFPNPDNAIQLGSNSNRWSTVFAVNGTIQTSDAREKTEVADSALGTEFIKALHPVSYKWIEGGQKPTGKLDEDGNFVHDLDEDNNWIYETVPGKRTHWGFLAQEVKEVVDNAGVDFGGWVLTEEEDPDSQQALRYDQFIAPLTKALQESIARIEALEAEVAELKGA